MYCAKRMMQGDMEAMDWMIGGMGLLGLLLLIKVAPRTPTLFNYFPANC